MNIRLAAPIVTELVNALVPAHGSRDRIGIIEDRSADQMMLDRDFSFV